MANKTIKNCTLFLLCCLSFLCTSCFSEVDLGFPDRITFPKEGGEIVAAGNEPFSHAVIQDYKGNNGDLEFNKDSTKYNVYDWLKVENGDSFMEELKMYAAPNTTGHRRKLYIELYSGPEYQVVKVIQE